MGTIKKGNMQDGECKEEMQKGKCKKGEHAMGIMPGGEYATENMSGGKRKKGKCK